MKPRVLSAARLSLPLATALAALTAPLLQATTLYWDSDTGNSGVQEAGGTFTWAPLDAKFWNGSSNVATTNDIATDIAQFGNGGTLASVATVNLSSQSINGLIFGATTTNGYTLTASSASQVLTLGSGGIVLNSGAQATTLGGTNLGITLGAAQSWTHDDDSLFTVAGPVNLGSNTLTLNGSGSGGTTLSGVISGTGALTINRSGSGVVTLSNTGNTFTGQLTVARGTLSIASINNVSANGTLGNNWLPVILGSSGNTGTLQYTAGSTSSTKMFTLATGGTGAFDITTALTLNGVIYGSGGLSKIGAGALTLTPLTSGSTATNSLAQNQFTGMTTVTAGRLILGSQGALALSPYDTTGASATVGLQQTTGLSPAMGVLLGGLSGSVNLDATMMPNYGNNNQLVLNPQTGTSVSYGGVIGNGSSAALRLVKMGPGTQTLTGANSFTGITYVYAGTLGLSGSGSILTSPSYVIRGGTLLLDNTAALADRLTDGAAITLGSLTLKSNTSAGTQAETVGATTFAASGKVTVDLNGGTAQTTLALGAVTRNAGAAIDFVGTGGTLGAGANSPNVTSSGAFPGVSNGILGWATVNGTQWAENNSGSIRAYTGTFVDPTSAASDSTKNSQLTGSGTMNAAKSFNSLNVISNAASQSLDLSTAGVLTLTSGGGILKSGANAYTISGSAASAITSGTELIAHVNGGALTISAPLNTAIVNIAKGGTGDLILSGTRAATMSGAISIAGGQLEFQGNSTTLSGVISGAGGLTVNLNAGQILTLSNSGGNANPSTYSGPTIVKGGILSLGSNLILSQLPNTHGNGAYFTWGGSNHLANLSNLELQNGILSVNFLTGATLGSGPGQLQITGGTSGFSSSSNGGLLFNDDANYEVVWGSAYFNPSTFVLNDSAASAAAAIANANRYDLNGATRTIATNSTTVGATLSGVIRNSSGTAAGITKIGLGTLTLSGANTYNGGTNVNAGTLLLSGANNLPTTGTLQVYAGGNFSLADGTARTTTTTAKLGLADGATLTFDWNAAALDRLTSTAVATTTGTVGIVINNTSPSGSGGTLISSASGGLTTANGTQYFLANNTNYTATLSVSDTAVSIGSQTAATALTNAYWMGNQVTNALGAMALSSGTTSNWASDNTGTSASGVVPGGAAVNIIFGATGGSQQSNVTTGANMNLKSITFNDTAAVTLGGNHTITLNSTTTTGATTAAALATVTAGSAISVTQYANAANTISANLNLGANQTWDIAIGKTLTVSGVVNGRGFGLTKNSAGTLILSGTNTYTGTTTISSGTLQIGNGGTTGSLSPSSIVNNAALVFNRTNTITQGADFASTISGTGTLTQSGTGTVTLTGTNTYTGATTITNGTLSIGTVATPTGSINSSSSVTVNGGTFRYNSSTALTAPVTFTSGTIGGTNLTGTLGGLTIGTNQTLSPGNSPGTAATTSQTWTGGGSYAWEINRADGTAGADPGWDLETGTGTLTITANSGSQFNLNLFSLDNLNAPGSLLNFNNASSYNWRIADFANTISTFAADAFNINTTNFTTYNTINGTFGVARGDTVGGDDTQIYLTYTPIPEPRAALLGGLGMLLLLRRRRA